MESQIDTHRGSARWHVKSSGLFLCLVLALGLAACSSSDTSSGNINFSLGLAGSTADHQTQPPTIAANGPQGTYAFVYDDQIWVRQSGQDSAKQLTKLVLSNGSTIRWGPLVWSPGGKYIAFTLVEDLNLVAGAPGRTDGPIYYVSTDPSKPQVFVTPGTGSIYGHSYDWLSDDLLMYSNGSGIQLYTLGLADPRSWQVRAIPNGPEANGGTNEYFRFGDIRITGGYLYYTLFSIGSPGRVGAIGSADIYRTYLGSTSDYEADVLSFLPLTAKEYVSPLGAAYADSDGAFVSGAWQIRNGTLIVQRIQSIDTKGGTVSSELCAENAAPFQNGCNKILTGAVKLPIAIHPQFALGTNGKIAYSGDNLYIQGQSGQAAPAGWFDPAAWSPNGVVAYTQLVKQENDAGGAIHYTTNIQVQQPGNPASTLIVGGQNLAWKP